MDKRRNAALRPHCTRCVVPETPKGVPFDASFIARTLFIIVILTILAVALVRYFATR